jgi:hypothetical protein
MSFVFLLGLVLLKLQFRICFYHCILRNCVYRELLVIDFFSGVQSLVSCLMYCRSLFVFLSSFLRPLHYQSFVDVRLLITSFNIGTKGVIGIRKSKKERQHKSQKKKTNNNPQNTTQKTKDRAIRTTLKTGGELRCSGRVDSSCSTSDTHRVTVVTNPMISHEWGQDRELCIH